MLGCLISLKEQISTKIHVEYLNAYMTNFVLKCGKLNNILNKVLSDVFILQT